jgi:glycosyltransferase involved in cell wall biosynthesis
MPLLISICIPAYNAPDLLEATLNSICNQNYKHLEIIISDDHSPVPLLSIFEQFKNEYPQYKWVYRFHQSNLGVLYNKKWLLDNSTGQLVSFFEHDDILIDRNHFLNVARLYEFDSNTKIFMTNALLSYSHRNILLNRNTIRFTRRSSTIMDGKWILKRMLSLSYFSNLSFSWSSIIFERKAAIETHAFSDLYITNEDNANKIDAYHNEENMIFVILLLEKFQAYFSLNPSTIRTISERGFSVSPTHPRIHMKNDIEFFNLWRGSRLVQSKYIRLLMETRAIRIGINKCNYEIYKYLCVTYKAVPALILALFFGRYISNLRPIKNQMFRLLKAFQYYSLNDRKELVSRIRRLVKLSL